MASKTTNYNLSKPSYNDNADIAVINSNMDIIDNKMKEIEDNATNATNKNASDISALNKVATTNLLNPSLQSQVINGITITANGDGTYTLNGTPSTESNINIGTISCLIGKTYRLVGRPAGIGTEQSAFTIYCDMGAIDYGNGIVFIAQSTTHNIILHLHPNIGALSNVVVKPMVTTALTANYDDFVPFTGTSGKLNGDVADIKKDIVDISGTYTITDRCPPVQGKGAFVILDINPKLYNITLNSVLNYDNGTNKDITLSRCSVEDQGFRYMVILPWQEIHSGKISLEDMMWSAVTINLTISKKLVPNL